MCEHFQYFLAPTRAKGILMVIYVGTNLSTRLAHIFKGYLSDLFKQSSNGLQSIFKWSKFGLHVFGVIQLEPKIH